MRFHDLRQTFANLLIAQGESLAYVRDQPGHASIQPTVDTYGHLIPGANRQAVDRLDDSVSAQAGVDPRNPEGSNTGQNAWSDFGFIAFAWRPSLVAPRKPGAVSVSPPASSGCPLP